MIMICPADSWPIEVIDQETGEICYFKYISYKDGEGKLIQKLKPIKKKTAEALDNAGKKVVGKTHNKLPSLEQLDGEPSIFG